MTFPKNCPFHSLDVLLRADISYISRQNKLPVMHMYFVHMNFQKAVTFSTVYKLCRTKVN